VATREEIKNHNIQQLGADALSALRHYEHLITSKASRGEIRRAKKKYDRLDKRLHNLIKAQNG